MILVESINIENNFIERATFDGRMGNQRFMAGQVVNVVLNINGEDAENVIGAINSDGTIYPDKIMNALGSEKRNISKEPIQLTRGIDL